jgi:pyruvate formate lyase activating enzyme
MIVKYPHLFSCQLCQRKSRFISAAIGICRDCLLNDFPNARPTIAANHERARHEFDLPGEPPHHPGGVTCKLCSNECQIGESQYGFCGLRTAQDGRLKHLAGTTTKGMQHWYRDPLPTNCVAAWVCEGFRHPGYHNLAVFYSSCTADCLFCQNWHYRQAKPGIDPTISASELAAQANERTFCVCYFGGDPSSQMPHALGTFKHLAERGVRICWETYGMLHPKLLQRAMQYAMDSSGCIKFDLKAFDPSLHLALTGVSNQRTLENFARVGECFKERPELPQVIASTLLVPGYIEADEVSKIASYIASINPDIPYSLLAFAPNFFMSDLPCTSISQAIAAQEAARQAGLTNVHIGNRHLLGWNNQF